MKRLDFIKKMKKRNSMWEAMLNKALNIRRKPVTRMLSTIRVVSATRLSEQEFWCKTALGESVQNWRGRPEISFSICFENKTGLSELYNKFICNPHVNEDVIVFIHDDVWIRDQQWLTKLKDVLLEADVVGVAGNTRKTAGQPVWFHKDYKNIEDPIYLSGQIMHGAGPSGKYLIYGKAPTACELLDGVFLAVHLPSVRRAQVYFDKSFKFHHYDMDFCRSARKKGLRLSTSTILLTHQSNGEVGYSSTEWQESWRAYLQKWGE